MGKLLQQVHPAVNVPGAIVAVNHGNRLSFRSGNHINFGIGCFQLLLQHNHGKDGGTGTDVALSCRHRIGGHHTCVCITFRRTQGNTSFQRATGIKPPGTSPRKLPSSLSSPKHLGQHLLQLPVQARLLYKTVELFHHVWLVAPPLRRDRKHSRSVANSQNPLVSQLPVDISCHRGEIIKLLQVGSSIQHQLIQVGDTPALRNVELKFLT